MIDPDNPAFKGLEYAPNAKKKARDALIQMLSEFCNAPKSFVVEVSGSEKGIAAFKREVSANFVKPKVSAPMKSGMIYVRVRKPANDYAGDVLTCHINTELL